MSLPPPDDASETNLAAGSHRSAWTAIALAFLAIFGFIMPMVYVPAVYALPIWPGTVISIGVVGGVLLICFLVGLAAVYTRKRNALDKT